MSKMSKMQIVINIPEVFYEALKKTDTMVSGQRSGKTLMSVIYSAVANGTPLPKNHGDLIDRDKLLNTLEELEWIRVNCSIDEDNTNVLEDIIAEIPTIIKTDADKEGKE